MNEYENMTKEELLTRCLFLDEVVAERNEQIEKMKNCANCKNFKGLWCKYKLKRKHSFEGKASESYRLCKLLQTFDCC